MRRVHERYGGDAASIVVVVAAAVVFPLVVVRSRGPALVDKRTRLPLRIRDTATKQTSAPPPRRHNPLNFCSRRASSLIALAKEYHAHRASAVRVAVTRDFTATLVSVDGDVGGIRVLYQRAVLSLVNSLYNIACVHLV